MDDSVWYLCKVCKKIFSCKKQLILHKRQVHPELYENIKNRIRITTGTEFKTDFNSNVQKSNLIAIASYVDPFKKESTIQIGGDCASAELNSPKQSNSLQAGETVDEFKRPLTPPPQCKIKPERHKTPPSSPPFTNQQLQKKMSDEFLIPSSVLQKITVYNYEKTTQESHRHDHNKYERIPFSRMSVDSPKLGKYLENGKKVCDVAPLISSHQNSNSNPVSIKPSIATAAVEKPFLKRATETDLHHNQASKRSMVKRSVHQCQFCGKFLSCARTLYDHKRLHTGEKPYGCKDCNERFATPSQMSRHKWKCWVKQGHEVDQISGEFKDFDKPFQNLPPVKGKWKCKVCGLEFLTLSMSAVHNCHQNLKNNSDDHKEKIEKSQGRCTNSNVSAFSASWSQNSRLTAKKQVKSGPIMELEDISKEFLVCQTFNGKNVFVCAFCMKVFSYVMIATTHVKSHIKNGDQIFNVSSYCKNQNKNKQKEDLSGMPILTKEFDPVPSSSIKNLSRKMPIVRRKPASNLTVQRNSRLNFNSNPDVERPKLNSKSDLESSQNCFDYATVKVENDFPRFVCNFCGKSFNYTSDIKSHIPLDTGQKYFKCSHSDCLKPVFNVYNQHERKNSNMPFVRSRRSSTKLAPSRSDPKETRFATRTSSSRSSSIDANFEEFGIKPSSNFDLEVVQSAPDYLEVGENLNANGGWGLLDHIKSTKCPKTLVSTSSSGHEVTRKPKRVSKVEAWLAKEANNLGRETNEVKKVSSSCSNVSREVHGTKVLYSCNFCRKLFERLSNAEGHTKIHIGHGHGQSRSTSVDTNRNRRSKEKMVEQGQQREEERYESDPDTRYCLCNQVSFGDMIACDATGCSIEWFHFTCVGLTSTPQGSWLCPLCEDNKF